MTRKARIYRQLDCAEEKGYLRSWYAQGNMPGMRWTVETKVGTRAYTTNEVEAFIHGLASVVS